MKRDSTWDQQPDLAMLTVIGDVQEYKINNLDKTDGMAVTKPPGTSAPIIYKENECAVETCDEDEPPAPGPSRTIIVIQRKEHSVSGARERYIKYAQPGFPSHNSKPPSTRCNWTSG